MNVNTARYLAVCSRPALRLPATCMRVLTVSNGNITQCSAIPAKAPLIMYLPTRAFIKARDSYHLVPPPSPSPLPDPPPYARDTYCQKGRPLSSQSSISSSDIGSVGRLCGPQVDCSAFRGRRRLHLHPCLAPPLRAPTLAAGAPHAAPVCGCDGVIGIFPRPVQ